MYLPWLTSCPQIYEAGNDHVLSSRADASLADSAAAYTYTKLNVSPESVRVHASYSGAAGSYAYIRQYYKGIPVTNAVANVAFNGNKKVTAFGSSFVSPSSRKVASSIPSIPLEQAITNAQQRLQGTHSPELPAPTLEYLARPDGSLALTHVFQVRNATAHTSYEASVDAHSGELLSVTDFTSFATYHVLPIVKQVPDEGFETLVNPEDTFSSPLGWHNDVKNIYNSTIGNNAEAFNILESNPTVQSGANLTFVFEPDFTQDPTVQINLDAARTNAFYLTNKMHDISYRYGFTETAFNFQTNNFGLGGKGNDRVQVDVQATNLGANNALFQTNREGINGFLILFLWTTATPRRDGAMENDIVAHEYTHGITSRLTGGGTATCLQTTESAGLAEGWSDAVAEWTEQTSATISDYVVGPYVGNNPAGLRTHPYSTSNQTNPLTYGSVATLTEVHKIGEVWANMLHNVYAALVGVHGFSSTAFTDPTGSEGNVVWMHILIDALRIQPCNPTFVNARDAWIQADATRYSGANKCLLWRQFASRGLGVRAANFTNDFTTPAGC